MKKKLFVTLILFFNITFCIAQCSKFYGFGKLTCTLINNICQDSDGFIWISTENGLNKFDGLTFTQYYHNNNDSTSLLNNYIKKLFWDSKKRLWVGSSKGIQYYSSYEDNFKTVSFPGNIEPYIVDIIELHNGEILIATAGNGLFKINVNKMIAIPFSKLRSGFLDCLCEDHLHRIWISIYKYGIVRMNTDGSGIKALKLPVKPTPSNYVISIKENKDGQIFVATSHNIYVWNSLHKFFEPIKYTFKDKLEYQTMECVSDGTVYVGTNRHGLMYIDNSTLELCIKKAVLKNSTSFRTKINAIFQDKDKNLWLGFFHRGLLMISKEISNFKYLSLSTIQSDTNDYITFIYKDHKGNTWMGVENEGVYKLDGNEVHHFLQDKRDVVSIFEDSNSTYWMGTINNGVSCCDSYSNFKRMFPELNGAHINTITEDKNKNLYFSIWGSGFFQYNLDTKKITFFDAFKTKDYLCLSNNWINAIFCDSKGLVWFGHQIGIDCFDPMKNKFCKLFDHDLLKDYNCLSFLEDRWGNLWIGTNKGLIKYNNTTHLFKLYSKNDGLPNNMICGLENDDMGNIWCSTFLGIFELNPQNGQVTSYLSGNGLKDKEYLQYVYTKDKNGTIYFCSTYGITSFQPKTIKPMAFTHKILLTGLQINGNSVKANTLSGNSTIADTALVFAKKLRFSYRDNTFSMNFSTMDFNDVENIYYEYRLDNLNSHWNKTSAGENLISYSHLLPGKYTLYVRACKNGVYSSVKRILINIVPPWYDTTLAKIFYLILFVASCLIFIVLIRRWHQNEINKEKVNFFINVSHEIRSPMTLIISPLSMLLKENYNEKTMNALRSMYKSANRIIRLINQMLDICKIDSGQMNILFSETNLVDYIRESMQAFKFQAEQRNIHFNFIHDVDSMSVWIDCDNFDKVVINLLSNAFKHTPDNGSITIKLTSGSDINLKTPLRNYAEIRVEDSGTGIDKDKLDKIFKRFYQAKSNNISTGSGIGLNFCKMLVDLHYGHIAAVNNENSPGCCFIIRIPLGKNHLKKRMIKNTKTDISHKYNNLESFPELKKEMHEKQLRSTTNYKILVIDDDNELRIYLKKELSTFYKVITCGDGNEGLRMAIEQIPDLIISDIVMPQLDGFSLLKRIKSNNSICHIPVVLLTSGAEYNNKMKSYDMGADAFLAKPFNIEELILICSNLISNRIKIEAKYIALEQKHEINTIEIKSDDDLLMERLMKIINNEIGNSELNVEKLSVEVGLSRVQLYRKLKEITGMPASDFIRNIRLNQAAQLMNEKKVNVSQAAYSVGFTSQSHFSTAFKKHFGCTPTEYIINHKTTGICNKTDE
ncbi:MAG: two-component regulator propeller domain-containing protein [Bacteroidaceae bacterium]